MNSDVGVLDADGKYTHALHIRISNAAMMTV